MEYEGYDEAFAQKISVALGGHHGNWPGPFATDSIDDAICPLWYQIRHDLYQELRSVFSPPPITAEFTFYGFNTLLILLSGLTSVADWVGSNADFFELKSEVMDGQEYAREIAVPAAQKALKTQGWLGWQPTGAVRDFTQSYAYLNFDGVRTVQQEIIDATINAPTPSLLIVEAPTGIGKTEYRPIPDRRLAAKA